MPSPHATLRIPVASLVLALGKPPHRSPVLPDVVRRLEAAEHQVHVVVPRVGDPLPDACAQADAVATRGLDPTILTAWRRHEHQVAFVDRPSAVLRVRDRVTWVGDLAAGGLPVLPQDEVSSWAQVRRLATATGERRVVVKQVDATVGRGAGVHLGDVVDLPPRAPFGGPYVVQRWHGGSGELKLYRYGHQVRALAVSRSRPAMEIVVDGGLRDLADRVAETTGVTMAGIDVLGWPDAPVIIDVNAFPSGRRLRGAAAAIADHLVRAARGDDRTRASR